MEFAPPHDLLAERSVLGCALVFNEALDELAEILNESAFHSTSHRNIWRAENALRAAHKPIDAITVLDALRGEKGVDAVLLADLAREAPGITQGLHHARIVKGQGDSTATARIQPAPCREGV